MIYHADARDILPTIGSGSVDMIFTDPPYRTISGGSGESVGHKRPVGMLSKNDGKVFAHNDIKPAEYAADLFRVLRPAAHCYVMTNLLNLRDTWDAFEAVGFRLHNLLVWRKQNCTPNRWYMKNCEFTLFFRKGPAFRINDCGSPMVHDFHNPVGSKTHETQKPVSLCRFYIENSTKRGDLVLDPFAGSGSTGVAAMLCGRRYIGIEIDGSYL